MCLFIKVERQKTLSSSRLDICSFSAIADDKRYHVPKIKQCSYQALAKIQNESFKLCNYDLMITCSHVNVLQQFTHKRYASSELNVIY